MVLSLAWLVAAAPAAGSVPADVRPVASPMDVQTQVDRWRAAHDKAPAILACTTLWPDQAQLCFRRGKGAAAYVTQADLVAWKVDVDGLMVALRQRSEGVVTSQLRAVDIPDTSARYWLATGEDRWAGALLLHPDRVADQVGLPLLVAVPADGIVLAWRGGNAETDKIVTVGVKEIHAAQPGSISPVVHRWNGTEWAPWAEAVKAGPPGP